jgi:hypothetical protein
MAFKRSAVRCDLSPLNKRRPEKVFFCLALRVTKFCDIGSEFFRRQVKPNVVTRHLARLDMLLLW